MTKEQIIRSISEEFKISELESIQFYENVFHYIENSFRKSKNLNITEFGKFNVFEKAVEGRAKVNSVKFSPSKKLATEVNYNYNNLAKILFRDIERNINKERILSLGEDTYYKEPAADNEEVFDKYSEEEKDFIEQQVNLTSANFSGTGLEDLEERVRKIEAFINVIRKFFEAEKLGESFEKAKTEIVPPKADYVKRAEDEKKKEEEYKASINALEAKIKELETKFKESEAKAKPEAKIEKPELPPIDVVPPVIEKPVEKIIPVAEEKIVLPAEEKIEIAEEKIVLPAEEKIEIAEEKIVLPAEEKIEIAEEKIVLPAEEKIEITEEKIVPPVEETKLPVSSLGNLVVESEFIREEEPVKDFVVPEIPKIDEISKPIEESLEPPVIETKIEERLSEIVKEHKPKKIKEADPSTRNIDDLLRTLGTPIEETEIEDEIIEEETIKEITEAPKAEDITEEFFIKTEEKPEDKSIIEAVPEIIEEKLPSVEEEKLTSIIEENLPEIIEEKKLPEIIEEKKLPEIIEEKLPEIIEEKKLPDTPLAGDISDAELQKKVDSLIAEFKTESSKLKDEDEEKKIEPEEEKQIEEIKEPEPEITKIAPPQDIEEAQLSSALSSIFNSILTSENIKKDEIQEKHIIKDEVKDLHNEIVKSEKPAETIVPPVVEETKETVTPSISDVYSSARSFNDIFVQKDDVNKDIMRAEDVKQIQEMHEAKEESRVELKEGMQIPVSEESKHTLRETNGPNLTESGIEHDIRTSKIYTNGNPLKPYANGKNGNSTFHQVLEDNGLQKESKTSIFIILAIIIIALGLLFFAIFNSGIMGKENPSLNEKNYGLVKVKENKNEKYFYDNGKDKVYFQTDKGFTIQAGSFKDKETAIEKRKELMNKKVENVRIEELEKDNSTFYRVRIGMFTALDEAKKYSEKF